MTIKMKQKQPCSEESYAVMCKPGKFIGHKHTLACIAINAERHYQSLIGYPLPPAPMQFSNYDTIAYRSFKILWNLAIEKGEKHPYAWIENHCRGQIGAMRAEAAAKVWEYRAKEVVTGRRFTVDAVGVVTFID